MFAINEYCLYGVRVTSDVALFNDYSPNTTLAPGAHRGLYLREDVRRQTSPADEIVPLYSTHGRDVSLSTDSTFGRSSPGQGWYLQVAGVVSFSWTGGGSTIFYHVLEQGTQALLAFWFTHIFLPLFLTLERGFDFIHCAAVEIDDKPVLFIAPSTGGKSALGDHFLKRGHPMLSDDKAATFWHENAFYAIPSHPHHRPFREFEVLGYRVDNFAASAKPIHAFYILEAGEPGSAIQISEVTGFRKFEELMPNYLYSFRFLQEQRLHWLAHLARKSLVFRVRRPWKLDRMQEVYEAICTHSRQSPPASFP